MQVTVFPARSLTLRDRPASQQDVLVVTISELLDPITALNMFTVYISPGLFTSRTNQLWVIAASEGWRMLAEKRPGKVSETENTESQ